MAIQLEPRRSIPEWRECTDSDNDGIGDNADVFPNDAKESRDSDNDGVGDNKDDFPNDANESKDSDADGVGDNSDAYPHDPDKTVQETTSQEDEAKGLPGFSAVVTLATLLSSALYVRSRNKPGITCTLKAIQEMDLLKALFGLVGNRLVRSILRMHLSRQLRQQLVACVR